MVGSHDERPKKLESRMLTGKGSSGRSELSLHPDFRGSLRQLATCSTVRVKVDHERAN